MASEAQLYLYTGEGSVRRDAVRVEVHRSVEEIPDRLFEDCDRLESLLLHEGLLKIGEGVFSGCSSLRSFRCPSTVTVIGVGAFYGCTNLATAELPEGLGSIEDRTFFGCVSLEEMRIPATVARIGDNAFYDCMNLMSLDLREGLRVIGHSAFDGCRLLGSLRVPLSVVEIGEWAFSGCGSLELVHLQEDLPTMRQFAFRRCPPESFRFARLSERMEALNLDEQTESMFEGKLDEITDAMVRGGFDWDECKGSLQGAHDVLTYWELKEATAMLELAFWRKKITEEEGEQVINNNQRTRDLSDEGRVSKRFKLEGNIDQELRPSRRGCRFKCGADVVIPEVLKFFSYSTTWS